ncbi:DUF2510 domain-containing protein [Cellulomonas sp. URHD0024]|uniref:DUF2510 domain-containing protein n=1 Tax=Cellulomonas sp. URHD0024 TaxID=1302620 RepID=UPI0012DFB748|nr:DUF2510 domain-containing protein [Cellulomonas sp. URHD0024]
MGTPPPAGWFTSPDGATVQRWWDGAAWTTFTQPNPAVPAQRVAAPQPVAAPQGVDPAMDERVRAASHGSYQDTAQALDALQHQGGILGAFAAVANQALATQQAPPPSPTNGVQPYGQPALQNPFGPSMSERSDTGSSVSWQVGPFTGGDRYDRFDRRRGNAGPVGTLMLGVLFLVVGFIAAFSISGQNKVHADESTTTGTVVAHSTRTDSHGNTQCSPIASFTVGGSTYKADSSSSSTNCASVGSSVPVIYTTTDPGDGSAHIKETGFTAWLVWLFPLIGLVVTVFAVRRLVTMGRSIRSLLPFGRG